jgi:L-lactate dehydrogenase complex protein LldG
MSQARKQILGDIRRALQRGRLGATTVAELEARRATRLRNPIPTRAAALGPAARLDLFVAMAEEAQAVVRRVADPSEVPAAVADYLAGENLPAELVMAPDPRLDEIPWASRPLLHIRRGRAAADDATSLTPVFAAIAETGTLMAISGPQTPTTLNFLPETHVAIVWAGQVVATYEDGWDRLPPHDLPRAINFITGPSRTADIEQQLVQGMHGPRRLCIVVIEDRPAVGDAEPLG